MSKIFPRELVLHPTSCPAILDIQQLPAGPPTIFTVWKRSSMSFGGTDGFTVFDGFGELVYRVDNYSRRLRLFTKDVVLMDGHGVPLISICPKIMSLHDQWDGYIGDESHSKQEQREHVFSIRKKSVMEKNRQSAHIYIGGSYLPVFSVIGNYHKRSCEFILTSTGEVAAEIRRKSATTEVMLGNDVFSLIVHQGIDSKLIMAFIVAMDRITEKRPLISWLCRS